MAEAALEFDAVSFRYAADAAWAVSDLSFEVAAGEVFGLLGPNGAGKSTALALIAGLLAPAHGAIRRPPAPRYALVPQEHAFYPMLSCRENLEFFAGVARVPRPTRAQRVRDCLAQAALTEVADKRASRCSGGIRRRLNLAIGLLADPLVLLLDEPTAGVDPQSRAFLLDQVRALRAAGRAIVYTSHYMDEVQAICDRVAIIDHGRLLSCGRLDELLHDSRRCVRVRVRGAVDAVTSPAIEAGWRSNADGSLSFELAPDQSVAGALAQLEARGIAIDTVQLGNRDLEDVFLQMTQRSLRD